MELRNECVTNRVSHSSRFFILCPCTSTPRNFWTYLVTPCHRPSCIHFHLFEHIQWLWPMDSMHESYVWRPNFSVGRKRSAKAWQRRDSSSRKRVYQSIRHYTCRNKGCSGSRKISDNVASGRAPPAAIEPQNLITVTTSAESASLLRSSSESNCTTGSSMAA